VSVTASLISTPTYRYQVRSTYDHHDVNASGNWGFSVVDAYRLGMRQAFFQLARDAALYGMNPQNGEGIINGSGITSTNLPADPNGATTVVTYDNGAMAFYLAQQVLNIKTRTYNLGKGRKFCFLGPQRDLGLFEYNVVQLTQFQRVGAGTASTKETLQHILMANGDEIIWAYDDTLIGAGANGNDLVLLVMPEVARPEVPGINTNEFSKLTPGSAVCTTQYCDMAAPREIISPLAGGATDMLMEWRTSSGWAVRPQAVTAISMQYQ